MHLRTAHDLKVARDAMGEAVPRQPAEGIRLFDATAWSHGEQTLAAHHPRRAVQANGPGAFPLALDLVAFSATWDPFVAHSDTWQLVVKPRPRSSPACCAL